MAKYAKFDTPMPVSVYTAPELDPKAMVHLPTTTSTIDEGWRHKLDKWCKVPGCKFLPRPIYDQKFESYIHLTKDS